MGGEKKKTDKKRVSPAKTSYYWTWTWPKNMAKNALRAYKHELKLHKDEKKALSLAQSMCAAAMKEAERSNNKTNIDIEAEFKRLLKGGSK